MLSQEQLNFFKENGYLLVKSVFSREEAAAFRSDAHALIERLAAGADLEATWGAARSTSAAAEKTAIYHCHNVQFYSAALTRLISDERFTGPVSDIMGTPLEDRHTLVNLGDRLLGNAEPEFVGDLVKDQSDLSQYAHLPFSSPAALEMFVSILGAETGNLEAAADFAFGDQP